MRALRHVTVGVEDLSMALGLWLDTFGLELLARRSGPDPALATVWELTPDRIRAQALVGTPGGNGGHLHLVEFDDPDPPVRRGAAATDRCPKNIDVMCVDLPERHRELAAVGWTFRSDPVEYPFEDSVVREVQMPAHDDVNVVLVEWVGQDVPVSPAGYAATTALVTIVDDADREASFHRDVLGFDLLMSHQLRGPEIERMVGLAPGGGLDLRICGDPDHHFGRVEVIRYEGAAGADLYSGAQPPALGTLRAGALVDDLDVVVARLDGRGVACRRHDRLDTIHGVMDVVTTTAPSGLGVEVLSAS